MPGCRNWPWPKTRRPDRHREKTGTEIRDFLEEKNILTVPAWLQHYRNLPYPAYLAPLAAFGVADDLTGPTRLKDDSHQLHRDAFA